MPVGNATLNWSHSDQMAAVQVTLTGLAPSSVHPVHIHSGSCGQNGRVLYPLLNLTADMHGVASSTTKLTLPRGIPASGWSLDVYNGPGLSNSDQALSIVCGNITNQGTSLRSNQSVQVPLSAPASAPNQAVRGAATLSLNNRKLTVKLTLSGLVPGSQHAVHIHAGTCASQGPVVYGLPVVKADAAGRVSLTTVIPNVSSMPPAGWYVNVHRSADLSTQTGFDPIACGNVVPARP
jgi:Cu/Zn superoxide dismutase